MDEETSILWIRVIKAFLILGLINIGVGLYLQDINGAFIGAGLFSLSLILAFVYWAINEKARLDKKHSITR